MNPDRWQTKWCARCGRTIEWRKKWARDWVSIQYCSKTCKRTGLQKIDHEIETSIIELLQKRSLGSTICPSEAARAVFPDSDWRFEMERVRQAARRLSRQSRIRIMQKGRGVDPDRARGPIRLKLKQN
ncbi:MAG: DUF3253 domain-containing protein [Pseudomonadota bacterium]